MALNVSSDCHAGKKRRVNNFGRSRNGCLTCRAKHVKCDEKKPKCGRCERLNLDCVFTPRETTSGDSLSKRPDNRPIKPRPEISAPVQCPSIPDQRLMYTRSISFEASDRLKLKQDLMRYDHDRSPDLATGLLGQRPPVNHMFERNEQALDAPSRNSRSGTGATLQNLATSPSAWAPKIYPVPSVNSLVLDSDENFALGIYRSSFSIAQTPKNSNWSFPTLLLRLVAENSMAIHLALAVSFQWMKTHSLSKDKASYHFQRGSSLLQKALVQVRHEEKIAVMASFFFAFVYMLKKDKIPLKELGGLSFTVLNYIKTFKLDLLGSSSTPLVPSKTLADGNSRESTFLARLLLWLYKEDVNSAFLGGKGHIARHFRISPERMMDIWRYSRPTLQLNWGSQYPLGQMLDDVEMSHAVDMSVELLLLRYEITECGESIKNPGIAEAVGLRFQQLNMKYDLIFEIALSTESLPTNLNSFSTVNAAIFYALQMIFKRSQFPDLAASEIPEAVEVMQLLFATLYKACSFKTLATFGDFQWALFIALIQSDDPMRQDWLIEQIQMTRYKNAARLIMDSQKCQNYMDFLRLTLSNC